MERRRRERERPQRVTGPFDNRHKDMVEGLLGAGGEGRYKQNINHKWEFSNETSDNIAVYVGRLYKKMALLNFYGPSSSSSEHVQVFAGL